MGREIAAKLMEFNKVVVVFREEYFTYYGEIEVIIPPTPKENLNAKSRPTNRDPGR